MKDVVAPTLDPTNDAPDEISKDLEYLFDSFDCPKPIWKHDESIDSILKSINIQYPYNFLIEFKNEKEKKKKK